MDEITRQKYKILSDRLYVIRDDIKNLLNEHDILKNAMKEVLFIDKKILKDDVIDGIKNDNDTIYNELNNDLIPRINNKI